MKKYFILLLVLAVCNVAVAQKKSAHKAAPRSKTTVVNNTPRDLQAFFLTGPVKECRFEMEDKDFNFTATFDEEGNLVSCKPFVDVQRDGKGRIQMISYFNKDLESDQSIYCKYSGSQNRPCEWSFAHNICFAEGYVAYDKGGNPVKGKEYGGGAGDCDRTTFTYEFDENGNWIARKKTIVNSYNGSKEYLTSSRSITYYSK